MVNRIKDYALYRGDALIGIGSAKELADILGVKISTIHFYKTPAYSKRTNPAKSLRLLPLD